MSSPIKVWRDSKEIKKFLGKRGKILVWTKISAAPAGFEHEAPLFVAIVQFKDFRMPLQIVDANEEDIKVGKIVETVVRRTIKVRIDEVIEYGVKARLI